MLSIRHLVVLLVGFWALSLAPNLGWAQQAGPPKGTIAGKVIDKATAEELPGSIVAVPTSTKGTTTDINGKFVLMLEPGTYTIRVSQLGYQTQEFDGIVVKSGSTTLLNAAMVEAVSSTAEIEVVAKVKKSSSEFLQLELRNADAVSSGLSSEVIRRTPDKTVADALKRVSGASIQDNKYAIVRGLADRYNLGYINGVPLPSSEADRKAFSLDLIPSAVVENIIISKTATPDMAADFGGGLVQINTKEIPFERTIFLQAGGQTHSLTTGQDFKQGPTSSTDWLGFDGGTRSLPAGLLPQDSTIRLQGRGNDALKLVAQSVLFNNNFEATTSKGRPNYSFQAGYADRYKVFGNDLGLIAFYTYSNSLRYTPSLYYDPRSFRPDPVTGVADTTKPLDQDSIGFDNYKVNIINAGILNLTYKVGLRNKFSIKNMFSQSSETQNVIRDRKNIRDGGQQEVFGTDYFYYYQSNRIINSQLSGEHLFGERNFKLNYTLGYNDMLRETPDFKRVYYDTTTFKPDPDPSTWSGNQYQARVGAFSNGVAFNPGLSGRFFSTLKENSRSVNINFTAPIKEIGTNVKTGLFLMDRSRSFNGRNFLYVQATNVNPGALLPILKKDPGSIFANENFSDSTLLQRESTQPSDVYTASSDWRAAFLMFDHKWFSNKLHVIWGARYETFNQKLNSASLGQKIKVDTTWRDLLPSANIVYNLTDKLVLRGSFSQTLSRPEFREFAPLAFYEINYNLIVVGNPTLERTRINNWDFKAEYYFDNGSLISVNPFIKYFSKPVEFFITENSGGKQLSYFNTKEANNYGIELEARVKLDFAEQLLGTKALNDVTLFGNYAYINSKVNLEVLPGSSSILVDRPLQGQSPYLINFGLQYNNEDLGLDAQLTYNKIGRRIVITSNAAAGLIWENPRDVLDLSISKSLYKHLQFRFIMGDILAQDLIMYQDRNLNGNLDDLDLKTYVFRNGRTMSLSLAYTF